MRGVKHLLLLAACLLLARCQNSLKVSMLPSFKEIFAGDVIYLRCDNSMSEKVTWYFNGTVNTADNKIFKIAVASNRHSGAYQCENNGQKSEKFHIEVLAYVPIASLTIWTGQPVMQPGTSITLQLHNDEGLEGWKCWVYRGGDRFRKIILFLKNNATKTVHFQSSPFTVPETTFWCSNAQGDQRSNHVTVRTSKKQVSLEAYPLPAVAGEHLTLKCLVWGTDKITKTIFYANNAILVQSQSNIYEIPNMAASNEGDYKCLANFNYPAHTAGPLEEVTSDTQVLYIQVPPVKAVLSGDTYLQCSCEDCSSDFSYYQYYRKDRKEWVPIESSKDSMTPKDSGTYACRAVWKTRRSSLSNALVYKPPDKSITVVLLLVVAVCLLVIGILVGVYFRYKRRNATGPVYEDVRLKSREKGEENEMRYEMLGPGAQREADYDTLHPEGKEKKEADYQPLKTAEMKEGVYHTLGAEGAAGGEGGYEALKKEGMKEGVYHTLGAEGAAGGEGGYEALKKEGMKEGVYHTLGAEGAAGGEGGYEALKKEGMKEGAEGAAGGEGRNEAVKNEGMKEEV